MKKVGFYKGNRNKLPSANNGNANSFFVTTDTKELFLSDGRNMNKISDLVLTTKANRTALDAPTRGKFYFETDTNLLYIFNGIWQLLNDKISGDKSAYEIWLDAGNVGSEQDFLNSLQNSNADTVDGKHVLEMTQSEYDNLTTKDENTIYIITDAVSPNFTIGTVTTLNPGSEATVTITGQYPNFVLNFGIPKGQ